MSAVASKQFGQEVFMDRHLSALKRCQFPRIIVDKNHVMTKVGETCARYQPNVSGTNDR
jgi:hypothetical protein